MEAFSFFQISAVCLQFQSKLRPLNTFWFYQHGHKKWHFIHFQISFVIPPDIIPGRMALLVTLVLVMINIFINMELPDTDSYTSVSIWMIFCIIFICLAFWEYGFILLVNHYHNVFANCKLQKSCYSNKVAYVDSIFSLICMIFFLIFNVIFCSNIDY